VLPFDEGVLVGTTDETFAAGPETAVATEEELDYLLRMVNGVMDCRLTRADITVHYSGVRPLPKSTAGDNAAISRDHTISKCQAGNCPVFTLVGGKLTTWREFSEQAADRILQHLNTPRRTGTHSRPIPGQAGFPASHFERDALWQRWSQEYGAPLNLIAALWPLYGTQVAQVLQNCRGELGEFIAETNFTTGIVRWVIEHESVRTLADLVERRLMLVFARRLSHQTLADLAQCLVAAGRLEVSRMTEEVAITRSRLAKFYGRRFD
jgi:glycerol-3-phosphate dehydrogenase